MAANALAHLVDATAADGVRGYPRPCECGTAADARKVSVPEWWTTARPGVGGGQCRGRARVGLRVPSADGLRLPHLLRMPLPRAAGTAYSHRTDNV